MTCSTAAAAASTAAATVVEDSDSIALGMAYFASDT